MALVIFNIGWMRFYRGQTESDLIVNGGSYVRDNKFGFEVENFRPIRGWYYGYVQPSGSGINLENLGVAPDAPHADDVTIVFTATPQEGGRVVVGWYQNARVWRDQQKRAGRPYFAKARIENCTLLEVDERELPVPRASTTKGRWGMGRSNLRYVKDADESEDFVCSLRKHMREYMQAPPSRRALRGGPRQFDPVLRAKVEEAAIQCVKDYYEAYKCVSVESDNRGWDLEFTRGAVRLLVEVKGSSGNTGQVELTPNEYAAMRDRRHRDVYRLAIVKRALDYPQLSIVRFNKSDETWRDQKNRKVRLNERKGVRVTCR